MHNLENNDPFLKDLLEQDLPDGFHEQLAQLGHTQARHRRTKSKILRAGMIVTSFLAILSLFLLSNRSALDQTAPQNPAASAPTPPLKKPFIEITSQPFANILRSTPLPSHQVLSSHTATLRLLHSSNDGYTTISDTQLLALFKHEKVFLVRHSNESAELIFLEDTYP